MLSRGKGVPDESLQALTRARALLEEEQKQGSVLRLQETRMGLEGEKRLSVELRDARALAELKARVLEMIVGLDLIQVKEEPYETKRVD